MTNHNILPYPPKDAADALAGKGTLFSLFVLEDVRQQLLETGEEDAAAVIAESIRKLEIVLQHVQVE